MGICNSTTSARVTDRSHVAKPSNSDLQPYKMTILDSVNALTGRFTSIEDHEDFETVVRNELNHHRASDSVVMRHMLFDKGTQYSKLVNDFYEAVNKFREAASSTSLNFEAFSSGFFEDCEKVWQSEIQRNARALGISISADEPRYAELELMKGLPQQIENGTFTIEEASERTSAFDELHEFRAKWHKPLLPKQELPEQKLSEQTKSFLTTRQKLIAFAVRYPETATMVARIWHFGLPANPEPLGVLFGEDVIEVLQKYAPGTDLDTETLQAPLFRLALSLKN
jgi:hypothetical protein